MKNFKKTLVVLIMVGILAIGNATIVFAGGGDPPLPGSPVIARPID